MKLHINNILAFMRRVVPALLLALAMTSCDDDFRDESMFIPEGEGSISLQMEFTPMAEGLTGGRASTAEKGDALNGIVDMCILFYDKDGNLMDDYVYYYNVDPSKRPVEVAESRFLTGADRFKEVDRTDADASNGHLAQEKSLQGTVSDIRIPFGLYYVVGIANLGNRESDKYKVATSTYDELFNNPAIDPSTLEGVRGLRLEWDGTCLANNAEMFGSFTTDQTSSEAARFFSDEELPSVVINRDRQQLTSWLRRAASKVTVAFDGTGLRDNIWIHLKSATIMDIPAGCDLGRKSMVTGKDSLMHESGQIVDYTGGKPAQEGGKYNTEWVTIVKGGKYPSADTAHGETELSLFFYENMQGLGKDKRQYPEVDADGKPTGEVKDDDIQKDYKPCGTYIEVKAFYRSRDGLASNGDIIYRFMLGKDVISDYNAERNYHYKLTLKFNGRANDYDWHIDYDEEPGIKVPIPYYYVPYMYNQHMVYPVTIVGELEGDLEAEIIRSDWGPSLHDTPGVPATDMEYFNESVGEVKNDGPWHGFLSLRQAPKESNGRLKVVVGGDKYTYKNTDYNKNYWEGNGDTELGEKVNHRGRRFYNTKKTPTSDKDNIRCNDDFAADGAYEVNASEVNGKKQTTFLIPLYSREMNLIKTASYRGNNPYWGHYRYAEIRFVAKIKGHSKPDTVVAKVMQVPRILNPKGIYRSWNCTDPFNVHLMKLESESDAEDINYTPVTSYGGPWSAEIEYMEGSGWLSVGGKKIIGEKIHGDTGSEIQFDVNFLSGTGSKDNVRCAVIKVLYHNYTCTHRIMVRQGYAPVTMSSGSTTKWHTRNLEYVTKDTSDNYIGHEEELPRGEGSMFRQGNLLQAIASSNNKRADRYKSYPDGRTTFDLAGESDTASWSNIVSNTAAAFKNVKIDVDGTECRVPTFDDFEVLHTTCDFGAGIMYGDGATETIPDVSKARGYASYLDKNTRKTYGMRGWFVYSTTLGGRNLFFPIGVSGNGHRKDGSTKTGMNYVYEPGNARGVLRYSARAGLMKTEAQDSKYGFADYRPLHYTMYTQFGAIYWLDGSHEKKTAWDINYSTFDFHDYGLDATGLFGDVDAGFIRLVED